MSEPHPLLELQRIDLVADGLRAEREGLPERAAQAEGRAALERLAAEREAGRDRLVLLGREERAAEAEVTALREKAKQVETTLYAGTVRAVSELEGLQTQLTALREQQAAREEAEMDVMARQEALEEELARHDRQRGELEQEQARLAEAIAKAEARIDAALAEVEREREAHLPKVPPAALKIYRRLRGSERLRGRVVATLRGDQCGACHTVLPMTHVARIRAALPDDPVACQRCQRLLVADAAG